MSSRNHTRRIFKSPSHTQKQRCKKKKKLCKDLYKHSDASSDTKFDSTDEMGLGQITKANAKYPNFPSVWSGTTLQEMIILKKEVCLWEV